MGLRLCINIIIAYTKIIRSQAFKKNTNTQLIGSEAVSIKDRIIASLTLKRAGSFVDENTPI